MSSSNSGSFSLSTTAAVVCFEKTETQPCVTLERRNTAATWSVTSMNSRAAWVRKSRVSARRSGHPPGVRAPRRAHPDHRAGGKQGWFRLPQRSSFGPGTRVPAHSLNSNAAPRTLRRPLQTAPLVTASLRGPCRSSRCNTRAGPWSGERNLAGLPHSAQITSWSSLARPVPRTLRLIDRQSGQRDGSCWNLWRRRTVAPQR